MSGFRSGRPRAQQPVYVPPPNLIEWPGIASVRLIRSWCSRWLDISLSAASAIQTSCAPTQGHMEMWDDYQVSLPRQSPDRKPELYLRGPQRERTYLIAFGSPMLAMTSSSIRIASLAAFVTGLIPIGLTEKKSAPNLPYYLHSAPCRWRIETISETSEWAILIFVVIGVLLDLVLIFGHQLD